MNTTRLWVFGALVLAIGVAIAGWLVGILPKLDEAARADLDRASAVEVNLANEVLLAQLKEQFETIGVVQSELDAVRLAVPLESNLPQLIDELGALAGATGAELVDVQIAEARTYGSPAALPVPATPEEGEEEVAEEAPVEVVDAAPVSPPAVTDPRITATNFVAIPITVTAAGSYSTVMDFVRAAQLSERLFLVTSLSIQPEGEEGDSPLFSGVLGGFVYVLLDPTAPEVVPVEEPEPVEPTPTPTPTPTVTPAPGTPTESPLPTPSATPTPTTAP